MMPGLDRHQPARWHAFMGVLAMAVAIGPGSVAAQTADDGPRRALRVCQDPNNLPFSNQAEEGLENRIAAVVAKAMALPLEHFWYPQRVNFVRNTLRYKLPGDAEYRCDLLIGIPAGFDQVMTTRPYYRSTYALVFVEGRKVDVRSAGEFLALDPKLRERLTVGIYDRSPATQWIMKHGLNEQTIPYRMLNADPAHYPGQIIEQDLAQGKIDAAVVWGPIAGFFARRVPGLKVIPLASEPGVKFDYSMAMGVRHGEGEWRDQVQAVVAAHAAEIEAILIDFGVPLVDDDGRPRD